MFKFLTKFGSIATTEGYFFSGAQVKISSNRLISHIYFLHRYQLFTQRSALDYWRRTYNVLFKISLDNMWLFCATCLLESSYSIMLVCYLVLENTQNLLNLISVNTNFLEAINRIDVCIGVEDEGKAVLPL